MEVPGVRWCSGVPRPGGAEGVAKRDSNKGNVITGLSDMKSGWPRRTSLRRMCASEGS